MRAKMNLCNTPTGGLSYYDLPVQRAYARFILKRHKSFNYGKYS